MAKVVYDGKFKAVEVLGRVVNRGEAVRVNRAQADQLLNQGWLEEKDDKEGGAE